MIYLLLKESNSLWITRRSGFQFGFPKNDEYWLPPPSLDSACLSRPAKRGKRYSSWASSTCNFLLMTELLEQKKYPELLQCDTANLKPIILSGDFWP
jgi:hypothetical protein